MSNLPPGVSESMIPGNRPEDEWYDKFHEGIIVPAELNHYDVNFVIIAVNEHLQLLNMIAARGFTEGLAEGKMQSQEDPFTEALTRRCESVNDGQQCTRLSGHSGDHENSGIWWSDVSA